MSVLVGLFVGGDLAGVARVGGGCDHDGLRAGEGDAGGGVADGAGKFAIDPPGRESLSEMEGDVVRRVLGRGDAQVAIGDSAEIDEEHAGRHRGDRDRRFVDEADRGGATEAEDAEQKAGENFFIGLGRQR